MSITKKELENLIKVDSVIEKISTLSSDGKNLLLRVPKDIREHFFLEKGDKIKFVVNESGKIFFDILKENAKKEEKRD